MSFLLKSNYPSQREMITDLLLQVLPLLQLSYPISFTVRLCCSWFHQQILGVTFPPSFFAVKRNDLLLYHYNIGTGTSKGPASQSQRAVKKGPWKEVSLFKIYEIYQQSKQYSFYILLIHVMYFYVDRLNLKLQSTFARKWCSQCTCRQEIWHERELRETPGPFL